MNTQAAIFMDFKPKNQKNSS